MTKREREQAVRRRRLLPLAALALIAFIVGAVIAAGSAQVDSANRFTAAWANQDFASMYAELSDSAKQTYSESDFRDAYLRAQSTGTATAINPGGASDPQDVDGSKVVKTGIAIQTRLFGRIEGSVELPFDGDHIAWKPYLTFPDLHAGELLGRRLELSNRAAIDARDGTALAEGPAGDRSSPLGSAALDVTGLTGKPAADQILKIQRQGLPTNTDVGISGLELAFNPVLAGNPGGDLLAVPESSGGGDVPEGTPGRVLGTATASPGRPVKTTIDPDLQQVSVAALGGQAGGVAVLDAHNGSVLALAGSAFSHPAPPGSTFKIITTTAALEAGVVALDDQFPISDSATVGGRTIENNDGEFCGGSFVQSFADSCNSVFVPLGPKIGNEGMVNTAEAYGFNQVPSMMDTDATQALDPPTPSIPTEIGDDLDLGVTAIGQGQVLSTPLEMASVAQAVAAGGKRAPNSIVTDPKLKSKAKPVRVTTPAIAHTLRSLMEDVVKYGTGVNAQIAGAQVAGKTGTAELGPKPNQPDPKPLAPGEEPPTPEQILDAWFTGFAPSKNPKLVVCVFLADASGDGGTVAAPIAAQILDSKL